MPSPNQPTTLLRDKGFEAQVSVLEERLGNVKEGVDRNHESTTSGLRDVCDKVEKLGSDLADRIDSKLEKVSADLKATYATKVDVDEVKPKVKAIQSNLSWGTKIVISAVITAIMGLLLAKGVHP